MSTQLANQAHYLSPVPLPPPAPEPPHDAFIQLTNVVKTFKTSAGDFHALRRITLGFEQGEFTSIMGKSGSGKSTLINMITGIDHPSSGSVRIGDTQLYQLREGQMAEWRGRNLGVVFQFFQLLPTLSVLENTMLPMDYCNVYPAAEREGRAQELLKMLALDGVGDKLPAALSGGQQQIAAIARSLANDPPIIIADEPTGNLDARTAELVLGIFADLAARGKTILIVTHDPSLARRSTRRVLISDGELVDDGVAQALTMLTHPQMLAISKLVTRRRFEPGATIARQGALAEGLYIITSGQVEVTRRRFLRQPETLGYLEPGHYLSEFEFVESDLGDLTFTVFDGPVDALCLSLQHFSELLASHPSIEPAMRRAAAEHMAEMAAAHAQGGKRRGRK
jgi:putative ABC transport system ATP-binding protein